MFSSYDLKSYLALLSTGYIKDVNHFTMGLVTPSGVPYMLQVNNASLVNTYLTNNFSTKAQQTQWDIDFANWYSTYSQLGMGYYASKEMAFIQMLQGSGLKLFIGNWGGYNDWDPIRMTNAVTVGPDPC